MSEQMDIVRPASLRLGVLAVQQCQFAPWEIAARALVVAQRHGQLFLNHEFHE
jgi:hypothetical protein